MKKLPFYCTIALVFLCILSIQSQSVGINTDGSTPDQSAALDIKSSSAGILIPRMTNSEKNNILNPAEGLLVYDTDSASFWYYQTTVWKEIVSGESPVFKNVNNVISSNTAHGTEDFVLGNSILPLAGNTTDTLMFFQHDQVAFRGGQVTNKNSWQPSNIGQTSFAYGRNVVASGDYSTAFGIGSVASGFSSFAVGQDAEATGERSIALGSLVGAEGDNSFAMGYETYASGENSIAMGLEAFADSDGSISIGDNTSASGLRSISLGSQSEASGIESISMGKRTMAQGNNSTVLGLYNNPIVSPGTVIGPTSPILTIGNGDSNTNRSNAMLIRKDGKVGIGTDVPREQLELDGAIVIANSTSASPVEGTLRYNGADYEGYDGTTWKNLATSDSQTLNFSNNILSISNGNSISLSASSDMINDADNNTKIQVEETSNDNIIRMDIDGEERFTFLKGTSGKSRLEFTNNDRNVIIGMSSGNALSGSAAVGNDNIFIGAESGHSTTNGSSNVFIGDESGKSNTLGSFNTFIGDRTGNFKQSGTSNLFLGFAAGEFNTSGSGNVFIGRQVDMPGSTSNRLAIHNTSSSEESEALVYGEFDNGLLRINGELEISDEYRFPVTNGLPNQVLATDANGDLNWVTVSGLDGEGLPAASKVYSTEATDFTNGPDGNFGSAVAISGAYSCIGARTEGASSDDLGFGRAYLYREDSYGWYNEDLFTPENNDTRSFGIAADMDANHIVVGSDASVSIPFLGRVFYYSYSPTGVTELDVVQSSDITNLDRFGSVVAISGSWVAVGAPAKNGNLGKTYMFRDNGSNLVEEQILIESGAAFYGASIDIDGDYMVIGAPRTGPASVGRAYIYKRTGTTWFIQHTINTFGSETGQAVAISGDKVAVSSTPNNGSQSVRILKRTGNTWTLEQTITAIDSRDTDRYGSGVSIDNNKLVIGASNVDNNAANTGAVYSYIFDGTTWQFVKKHIAPNAQANDRIGLSLRIDGNTFIAGGGSNTKVFIDEF